MSEPVLSVLVISHNQKDLLRRCVESILVQDLPFEHEIVISDDASSDGTWELAMEYSLTIPSVKVFQCDSNDCQPANTSERSGFNRSNAYAHSTGKYFCHIDADDYYRGSDCLRLQVELLENHQDCSICMQNDWVVVDGKPLDSGCSTHNEHQFETGRVVSPREYLTNDWFINNGSMMMRRNRAVNPAALYGKWYVDSIITEHHLQFGSIVCLDRADWVYVQYPKSITSAMTQNDQAILWPLNFTVFGTMLIPAFCHFRYSNRANLSSLLSAVKKIRDCVEVSEPAKSFSRQFDKSFLFSAVGQSAQPFLARPRLFLIRILISVLIRTEYYTSFSSHLLNMLCGGCQLNSNNGNF